MLKVFIDGYWSQDKPKSATDSLLLTLVERASGTKIEIVETAKNSDFIILYPFIPLWQRRRMGAVRRYYKFLGKKPAIKDLMGYLHNNVLAVSHENLDHHAWSWFANLIFECQMPRLTFWPQQIDPKGARFPYWWNYIQYEDIELSPDNYSRYGKPLDLKRLMSPFCQENKRQDWVVFLNRHMRYPRNSQVGLIQEKKQVDIYMPSSNPWQGNKYDLISKYKYVFCAENSCGYGYETEKLPEAWDSGTIPVGYVKNPLGDFNIEDWDFDLSDANEPFLSKPLITEQPDLYAVIGYLKNNLNS